MSSFPGGFRFVLSDFEASDLLGVTGEALSSLVFTVA